MPARHPRFSFYVALVVVSGACALVYQLVWTRSLRLVFGASTAASAAVLAIFMGGLGLGGHLLGRRADRSARPLVLYGTLELAAAVLTALSPWLVDGVRLVYLAAGGEPELGRPVATLLRLVLAAAVLLPPTLLLGGTLPAIVRAAERAGDAARRRMGLLYGANTLGAVAGAALSTFWMIEIFGVRTSLWIAALVAALIGVVARAVGRTAPAETPRAEPARDEAPARDAAVAVSPRVVYAAAFVTGLVFFAMEIVWTRMLGPLLGGSVYGFGLVLVVALSGIGIGARLYGRGAAQAVPTAGRFALSCALEAAALGLPLLAGDALVAVAYGVRTWNLLGFDGLVAGWALVAGFCVFLPSLVAGYQFPLLVGLLGRGAKDVGRQVGTAYLWNTAGAIAGALVAGFGLLQGLGAVGLWRALVFVLVGLCGVFLVRARRPAALAAATALTAALALATTAATGPTAAWRHSPVGAGRVTFPSHDPLSFERYVRDVRRSVVWEADGVETSFAVVQGNGYSFLVTGKSDGNAKADAPTVIMLSLLGAALHPDPRSALVIGLGTGTSAGWIADAPTIEHVDVVELEPRIADFARMCAAVNRNLFDKSNVSLFFGDAREFLQAAHRTYDVVISEPSNPYRVGIASLFSRDFYEAAVRHMSDDGVYVQWFQAYEVDGRALRTAVATLASVFAAVEIWSTREGDLALVAYRTDPALDPAALAERLGHRLFVEGLAASWGATGIDGLLGGYLAGPAVAAAMAEDAEDLVDTDDRPVLEFGFQRTLGAPYRVRSAELRAVAARAGADVPAWAGTVDRARVLEARSVWAHANGTGIDLPPDAPGWVRTHDAARRAFAAGDFEGTLARWTAADRAPRHPGDLRMLAYAAAKVGRPEAEGWIEALEGWMPSDARVAAAVLAAARGDRRTAAAELVRAFEIARENPWGSTFVLDGALALARQLGLADPALGRPLYQALGEPFAVAMLHASRVETRLALAAAVDWHGLCAEALAPFEPHAPWQGNLLGMRVDCYEATGDAARLDRAREDLEAFAAMRPLRVSDLFELAAPDEPAAAGPPASRRRDPQDTPTGPRNRAPGPGRTPRGPTTSPEPALR